MGQRYLTSLDYTELIVGKQLNVRTYKKKIPDLARSGREGESLIRRKLSPHLEAAKRRQLSSRKS